MDNIKIGPITYTIRHVDGLEDNGVRLHGQYASEHGEIRLDTKGTPDTQFVTLWHETLHALSDVYGFSLSERNTCALASGIVQVLQDNPEMNWLEDARLYATEPQQANEIMYQALGRIGNIAAAAIKTENEQADTKALSSILRECQRVLG